MHDQELPPCDDCEWNHELAWTRPRLSDLSNDDALRRKLYQSTLSRICDVDVTSRRGRNAGDRREAHYRITTDGFNGRDPPEHEGARIEGYTFATATSD
jgi:hypothetical protein